MDQFGVSMMLKLAALLLLVPGSFGTATAGTVVQRLRGCDYFVVQTRDDYALLEWYGGHDPDKGDTLIGNFNSYGMKTFIYAEDEDRTSRLYVEDYGLSKSVSLEKLIRHCE